MKNLQIVCIFFAITILITSLVLFSLKITDSGEKGPEGKQGDAGKDQNPIENTVVSFSGLIIDSTFVTSLPIFFVKNAHFANVVTTSFELIVIEQTTVSQGDLLPLLNITADLKPSFAKGYLGVAFNILNTSEYHGIFYDAAISPNIQFVARSSSVLHVSDRFQVNVLFNG